MGDLRDKKIITFQGKQGWWVKKSAILSYLTSIESINDLDQFIQKMDQPLKDADELI